MNAALIKSIEKMRLVELTNFTEIVDDDGELVKHAITDIAGIWKELSNSCEGRLKRIGKLPFFVQASGEILIFNSATELFGFFFSRGMEIKWSDRLTGAITKSEFYQYIGKVAEDYDLITSLPHYPRMSRIFYSRTITAQKTGALDELSKMFNYATEEDRQKIRALFKTPFWGGPGGMQPAFLIDGLPNDPLGNRGIGKTSVTDALNELCGGCVDISNKTEGEEIRKRLLTSGDVRLVRMDNIKTSSLSNDVIESLITAKEISGHKMYKGHASVPNWFTFTMTFNDATLSRDMAQRTVIIRLKRQNYNPDWYLNISNFIEKNRERIIADIGYELGLEGEKLQARTRFPVWERDVLSKGCENINAVLDNILREQTESDSETQTSAEIREIMVSKIDKFWRLKHFSNERVYFDAEKNSIAIPRSMVLGWIAPLIGKDANRKYLAKRFESARPKEVYPQAKKHQGDWYMIWIAPGEQQTPNRPFSVWRVDFDGQNISTKLWDIVLDEKWIPCSPSVAPESRP